MARLLLGIPTPWLDRVLNALRPLLPQSLRYPQAGDKLHKLAELFTLPNAERLYRRLISHWKQPATVVIGAQEPATVLTDPGQWAKLPDFTQRMMYFDTLTYLPDDILVKVDRAAMSVSLESRVPFLDHRVVEWAWRTPLHMKIRNGEGKWLLRQVLYQYVPKELIERPKQGFGVPIDHWLRGPLRDWAEALLDESRLRREEFFHPQPIRAKWAEHLAGTRNWQYYLWDVLMFQAWLENIQPVT
jgi:asparagine synthase (glutamine-hydrolysing)